MRGIIWHDRFHVAQEATTFESRVQAQSFCRSLLTVWRPKALPTILGAILGGVKSPQHQQACEMGDCQGRENRLGVKSAHDFRESELAEAITHAPESCRSAYQRMFSYIFN